MTGARPLHVSDYSKSSKCHFRYIVQALQNRVPAHVARIRGLIEPRHSYDVESSETTRRVVQLPLLKGGRLGCIGSNRFGSIDRHDNYASRESGFMLILTRTGGSEGRTWHWNSLPHVPDRRTPFCTSSSRCIHQRGYKGKNTLALACIHRIIHCA